MDLGCYCVNFSRLFAGEPQQVEAHANFVNDVDLSITGLLEFPGEATATFFCSFETEGTAGAEIVGTAGRIVMPHPWLPPVSPAEIILTRSEKVEVLRVNAPPPPAHHFALEIEHFAACVRENRAPQFPPGVDAEQDSRGNIRVIEMLLDSARH